MKKIGLSTDKDFMKIALEVARKSPDPSTKVGCVIVKNKKIISYGCNCFPKGCEKKFPWSREGDWLKTKYPYVVHAEMNSIISAKTNLEGCSLYVTLAPCNDCAKAICVSGIKKVFYLDDKYAKQDSFIAGKKLLKAKNIIVKQIKL